RFSDAAGSAASDQLARSLATARDAQLARIQQLAAQLQAKAPRYWDYRAPEPLGVAALQASRGADAALLRDDEALIVFLVTPGPGRGLVFAVTKLQCAWAQLGFTGQELEQRVARLRAQIDPEGYRLRGLAIAATAQSAGAASGDAAPATSAAPAGFDRLAAYELYQ